MEMTDDLAPFLNPWNLESGEPRLLVDVAGARPSLEQLKRAVNFGLPIDLDNTTSGDEFSLRYLEPVIDRIAELRIISTGIFLTDTEVLQSASRLASEIQSNGFFAFGSIWAGAALGGLTVRSSSVGVAAYGSETFGGRSPLFANGG